MTIKVFATTIFLLAGCSNGSPERLLTRAENSLGEGNHTGAVAAADEGLAKQPTGATRWRLELVRLEALARSGQAGETIQTIERLAGEQDTPVSASHYLSTADQLRTAGERSGAIELLDKGKRRFPENTDITQAISRAKDSGSNEELDTLRSLGYMD